MGLLVAIGVNAGACESRVQENFVNCIRKRFCLQSLACRNTCIKNFYADKAQCQTRNQISISQVAIPALPLNSLSFTDARPGNSTPQAMQVRSSRSLPVFPPRPTYECAIPLKYRIGIKSCSYVTSGFEDFNGTRRYYAIYNCLKNNKAVGCALSTGQLVTEMRFPARNYGGPQYYGKIIGACSLEREESDLIRIKCPVDSAEPL